MAPASCCARSSRPTKTRPTVALGHLSDETVRRRFLAAKPRFSSGELRYLTEVDGHDHVAIVALLSDDPETIVGVARCVRLPGAPDTAEFAIVVADGLQGRRLGTLLARTLADAARAGPGGAAGTWSSGFPRVLHSGMVARAPLCSRRRWT